MLLTVRCASLMYTHSQTPSFQHTTALSSSTSTHSHTPSFQHTTALSSSTCTHSHTPSFQHITALSSSTLQCSVLAVKLNAKIKIQKTLKSEHSAKLMQPQQCQVSQIDKKELKFARKQMCTLGLPSAVL